jgi:hypothetical protein
MKTRIMHLPMRGQCNQCQHAIAATGHGVIFPNMLMNVRRISILLV